MGGIREWGVWGRQSLLPAVKAENMRCLLPPVLAPRTGDMTPNLVKRISLSTGTGDAELKWRLGVGGSPSEAGSSGLGAHVQSLGPQNEPDLEEVCDRDVASPRWCCLWFPLFIFALFPFVPFQSLVFQPYELFYEFHKFSKPWSAVLPNWASCYSLNREGILPPLYSGLYPALPSAWGLQAPPHTPVCLAQSLLLSFRSVTVSMRPTLTTPYPTGNSLYPVLLFIYSYPHRLLPHYHVYICVLVSVMKLMISFVFWLQKWQFYMVLT